MLRRCFTDRTEIEKILPQREDMLLIDEAYLNDDGSSTAYYTVRGDEYFLRGHFPGHPVVPGVILCEMMGQAAAPMFASKAGAVPYYTGIDGVRFRSQVRPGDRIRLECRLVKSKMSFFFIAGEAYVGDRLCARGEFSFYLDGGPKGDAGK